MEFFWNWAALRSCSFAASTSSAGTPSCTTRARIVRTADSVTFGSSPARKDTLA